MRAQCMHGDLTPRNILLNASRTVAKIGDLGLTKRVQASVTEATLGGTLAFAAPEVLLNLRCNEKVCSSCGDWSAAARSRAEAYMWIACLVLHLLACGRNASCASSIPLYCQHT